MKERGACIRHEQYYSRDCPLCKVSEEEVMELFDKTIDDLGLRDALRKGKEHDQAKLRQYRTTFYKKHKNAIRKYTHSEGKKCLDCSKLICNKATRCNRHAQIFRRSYK